MLAQIFPIMSEPGIGWHSVILIWKLAWIIFTGYIP